MTQVWAMASNILRTSGLDDRGESFPFSQSRVLESAFDRNLARSPFVRGDRLR